MLSKGEFGCWGGSWEAKCFPELSSYEREGKEAERAKKHINQRFQLDKDCTNPILWNSTSHKSEAPVARPSLLHRLSCLSRRHKATVLSLPEQELSTSTWGASCSLRASKAHSRTSPSILCTSYEQLYLIHHANCLSPFLHFYEQLLQLCMCTIAST